MSVQFVEIGGQRIAMLPAADYERLLDAVEDRADTAAAEAAEVRRAAGEEYVPLEVVDRLVGGDNPLRVWREYRGLSVMALAERLGCQRQFIYKLERGERTGDVDLWIKLADCLGVAVEDLRPQP
ncbi:transcriptional regulator [Sphingomonas spermidinifaciens]|uniref:Transcriptional regulator n=1 Tax=Sphingomonas spermidinifaciens TaxID=1141889 RepID=A0A2A4B9A8_9SPHN|nr:helix-turn-helix transcriptional regulator [Sphingomonas spermidinifaciens]PCD04246.1 transcriptional regulator [Sphingomonas spermidinifaciens]